MLQWLRRTVRVENFHRPNSWTLSVFNNRIYFDMRHTKRGKLNAKWFVTDTRGSNRTKTAREDRTDGVPVGWHDGPIRRCRESEELKNTTWPSKKKNYILVKSNCFGIKYIYYFISNLLAGAEINFVPHNPLPQMCKTKRASEVLVTPPSVHTSTREHPTIYRFFSFHVILFRRKISR